MTRLELAGITSLQVLVLAAAGCGSVTMSTAPSSDAAAAADVGGSAGDAGGAIFDVRVEVGADHGGEASVDVGRPPVTDCSYEASGAWTVAQCPADCTKAICTRDDGVQLVGCMWTSLQATGPSGGRGQFYCPVTGPDAMFVKPSCVARCP